MILKKFLKKVIDKVRKPKPQLDISSTSNETVEYTFTNTEVLPKKEPRKPVQKRKPKKAKIDIDKICNNCDIEMIEKTSGLKHSKNRSRIRKYLVCPDCGFEKRLAV